jgi:N-acyl-D-amino-acid deacylase
MRVCGFAPFPLDDSHSSRAFGVFFEPDLRERWPSLSAYAAAVRDTSPAINVAPLAGLGAIRLAIVGDEPRSATESEVRAMRQLVADALADGAFGVSSGLVYAPGSYADVAEISEVASPLAACGGLYASHLRNEAGALEAAVEEALEVGRRVGCPVQLSHHKCLGRANWGKVHGTLRRVDEANESGHDVALDVYPYTAGSSTLASLLPSEELAGGEAGLRRRLADSDERARLARLLEDPLSFRLDDVIVAAAPSRPEAAGQRLTALASRHGVTASELALRLLDENGFDVVMVAFGMDENDVREVLLHPRAVVASDGWTMTREATAYAHPRNFACTARLLARYVRDEMVLSLTGAMRKLTSAPADRLGLRDRGRLVAGAAADVVVIDLEQLTESATYEQPCAYPVGVEHVFVNGVHAVDEGSPTGCRGGAVLRRGSLDT